MVRAWLRKRRRGPWRDRLRGWRSPRLRRRRKRRRRDATPVLSEEERGRDDHREPRTGAPAGAAVPAPRRGARRPGSGGLGGPGQVGRPLRPGPRRGFRGLRHPHDHRRAQASLSGQGLGRAGQPPGPGALSRARARHVDHGAGPRAEPDGGRTCGGHRHVGGSDPRGHGGGTGVPGLVHRCAGRAGHAALGPHGRARRTSSTRWRNGRSLAPAMATLPAASGRSCA